MSFTFIFILIFVLNNMITRRRRGRVVKGTTPQTRLAVSIYKMLSVFSTTKRKEKKERKYRKTKREREERRERRGSQQQQQQQQLLPKRKEGQGEGEDVRASR